MCLGVFFLYLSMFSCFDLRKTYMRVEKIFNYGKKKKKCLAQFYTFVEIDHEMISTDMFLSFAESFKKGCCQLQENVCERNTG